jgi:hypothetical protein
VKPCSFQDLVYELQGRILNIQYGLFNGIESLVNQALAAFPTVERVVPSFPFHLMSGCTRRTLSVR